MRLYYTSVKSPILFLLAAFLLVHINQLHAQDKADSLQPELTDYPLKTSFFEGGLPAFHYRGSLKSPIGFAIGPMMYYSGAYLSFRFGSFVGVPFGAVSDDHIRCNDHYVINGDEDYSYVKIGESSFSQGSFTAGYISRFHYNLLWYIGAGFGWYQQYDLYDKNHNRLNLSFEEWAYHEDESTKGFETEFGIMIDLKYVTLSTGVTWTNFLPRTMVVTFGIGSPLTKVKKKK